MWPEPKSSAAGSRMLQLITLFKDDGYEITFACSNNKTENACSLETLGITEILIQLNHDSFDDFITNLQPTIVLFDRFISEEQFGWRVSEFSPHSLRILDTEDLHGLRKGRTLAVKNNKEFNSEYLLNDTMKRELASIYRCDLSLIISKVEMQLLTDDLKVDSKLLHYIPFLLESITKEDIAKLPSFESRKDFVTIGNFLHEPNCDAVLQLKRYIWPIIKKALPKANLHIYGAYASQKVKQLHNTNEGFYVHGFSEDVNTIMQQSKVCLAPLRFGAGLKGKIFDALKNGTPSIMTSVAAEGIFLDSETNNDIQDSPEAFAQRAIELHTSKCEFYDSQNIGFNILNTNFLKLNFISNFQAEVSRILRNLNTHRLQNVTGQVLQHQSLQSSKYLSKWIAEKNK
ncbi:glycosyltransferase [Ichthyenterobacterium sp. W332]|uniref:Glycosyltransferase n=1 Tax=Microcosmobacter mediterraneus TaxID=3075607 RepID=A0ABU2YHR5_9FLAO|nr:glycosyltransferase [Ichthyenterobacterium sp. W332]MDT0557686.1 glycosyltransferase [Ichthyenterobacterium sp. W332]